MLVRVLVPQAVRYTEPLSKASALSLSHTAGWAGVAATDGESVRGLQFEISLIDRRASVTLD